MQIQKANSLARRTHADHNESDQSLIDLIANGDQAALKALFGRNNERIYHFVLRLTNNRSIAEEAVSDVFVAVWQQAKHFQAKSRVSTWLLTIARHKALSALQRQKESQLDEHFALSIRDGGDTPEEAFAKQECRLILQHCLCELPSAHRQVIDLFYFHGKSVSEVGEIVGTPASTVKTRMFYARRRLAMLLGAAGVAGAHTPNP